MMREYQIWVLSYIFLLRTSLPSDAPDYFDPATGVLEVPLHIKVADQVNKT